MKKIMIILIILVCISFIFVLLLRLSFIRDGRDWFVDRSATYVKNCRSVKIGTSFDEVVNVMGKPDSDKMEDGKRNLIYFTGGLKTEAGIGFGFEDNLLIRKYCVGEWETE